MIHDQCCHLWIVENSGFAQIPLRYRPVGEYEETIGTCIAFSEQVAHEESGPSTTNLFSGTRLIDSSQPSTKQVKPVCQLHKILKFKLSHDSEICITERR
ncbi:general transcription factor 3C polypeptide [Trifolium repens]|nr:general transcription factor 3C polypeptide [Trifolium repens]